MKNRVLNLIASIATKLPTLIHKWWCPLWLINLSTLILAKAIIRVTEPVK